MKDKAALAFFRSIGATDEQIIAVQAEADQIAAATEQIIRGGIDARLTENPIEAYTATKAIETIVREHGECSPAVVKLVISLAVRAAGVVIRLTETTEQDAVE